MELPELSVVIPVYRSEEILPRLCRAIREALEGHAFEVVLVNDRSPDGSWEAISAEARQDPRIIGVNLRVNVGQDRAIMAGLSQSRGRLVVIMDDDLQQDPADIPALVREIGRGHDVVYAAFHEKRHSAIKNLGSWAAGKVAEKVLRKPPHIYMSPFKILRREVVDEILEYRGPFPYVDGLLFQITDSIGQITVEHHDRHSGSTTHNFWKQAQVFLNLATNFSIIPLRFMTGMGLLCFASSLVLAAYFLVKYFTKGIGVYGWTALALMQLLFGGVIMISIGALGEYLGRVLMNVNQTPQFVVRETTVKPVPPQIP